MEYVFEPFKCESTFKQELWAYWDDYFSEPELDILQNIAKNASSQALIGASTADPDVRRTLLHWVYNSKEYNWLYKKLGKLITSINNDYFRFDLIGCEEPIQLANYTSVDKGMYTWHVDRSSRIPTTRKLSVVMQLSHPEEYDGGQLELKVENDECTIIPKRRGLIVVFPSWTIHRVTPVTAGNRQSLVQWVSGPEFK